MVREDCTSCQNQHKPFFCMHEVEQDTFCRTDLSAEQQAEWGHLQEGPSSKASQVQGCAFHDHKNIAQGC